MAQGWKKAFERLFWKNRPSTDTPLNATDMNHIESGIDALDDRIVQLDVLKADAQVVNGMVSDVSLNSNTGVITVTYKNGSHVDYDTNLEKIAVNFSYDYINQRLVLTLPDGTTQYVDMSALITQYEFKDSTTIAFSVDSSGKVSASIKNGSITEAMLETGYLANIKVEVAKAEAAATQAQSSEASSDYNAKLSRSYAIGGSGIREGEDTDNAMYYYEQAKKTDIGQIRSEVDELNSNLDALQYSDVAGGSNIWDEIWENGYINKENGENVNASIQIRSVNYISVKPSTTYTITCSSDYAKVLLFYDSSKNFIESKTTDWKKNNTFITPNTCSYLRFYMPSQYGNIYKHDIAIIEGTATDYEPYIPSVKMLAEEVDNVNESLEDYGLDNVATTFYQGWLTDTNVLNTVRTDFLNCSAEDIVSVKCVNTFATIYAVFYDSGKNQLSIANASNTKELSAIAPTNSAYCIVNVVDNKDISPSTIGKVSVYVNNAIDKIKNDLYKRVDYSTVDIFTAIKQYDETAKQEMPIQFVVQTQTIVYIVNGFKHGSYSSYLAHSYENGAIYHVRSYNGVWSYKQLAYMS